MSKIVKKKIKIEGMHCASCATCLDLDLEDLEGVSSSNTSYAKQITEVEFDEDKLKIGDIFLQIKKTGYKACDIK